MDPPRKVPASRELHTWKAAQQPGQQGQHRDPGTSQLSPCPHITSGPPPTPDTGFFLPGKAAASDGGMASPPPPHTLLSSHPAARGLPSGGVFFPWGQSTHKLITWQRVKSPQQGCRTEAGVAWPGSGRRGQGLPHGVRPVGPSSPMAPSAVGSWGHLSGVSEVGTLECYHDLSVSLLGSPIVGVSPDSAPSC